MKSLKIIYSLFVVILLSVFIEGRVAIANNKPANPVYGFTNCLYHASNFDGCVQAMIIIHTDPEFARCVVVERKDSCLFNSND